MKKITLDQLSILLVEPSSTQQRIICNHLNGFGVMNIDKVSNGTAALDTMDNNKHDLIISSMHLEDMTGTELVQNMRMDTNHNEIPFMLISSETDFRYLEPIRQAGVIREGRLTGIGFSRLWVRGRRAMHRQDPLLGHPVVEIREDGLLHLAGILRAEDHDLLRFEI